MSSKAPASTTSLRRSTMLFSGLTLLSRIFGMAREVVATAALGVSGLMSAFTLAFQAPNVVRAFITDMAISTSLVPAISPLLASGERQRAYRVAATVGLFATSFMLLVAVTATIFAPALFRMFVGESFDSATETIELFRILVWILPLMAGAGLIIGILNAHDHFALPAAAPIAWNAVVIASLIVSYVVLDLDARTIVFVYAWSVLAGTVLQVLMPLFVKKRLGFRLLFGPRVLYDTWKNDPLVMIILIGTVPIALTLVLTNLAVLVNLIIATRVEGLVPFDDAGPAILDKAWRLYMLPQGAFTLAVGTVFFPRLSRAAADRDAARFKDTVRYCGIALAVVLLPIATIGIALAEPATAFVYQRGEFGPEYVPYVGRSLRAFLLGLIWQGWAVLLIRSLFATNHRWLPVGIGVASIITNTVLALTLHPTFGLMGIALAMGLSQVVIVLVSFIVLSRNGYAPRLMPLTWKVTVIGVIAVIAGFIAEVIEQQLAPHLPYSAAGHLVVLATASSVSLLVYLLAIRKLRIIRSLRSLVRRQ